MARPALSDEELLEEEITSQPIIKPLLGGLPVYSVAEQDPYLNGVLIFGYSKSGKTKLLATAAQVPELRPIIIIDWCEKGTKSARKIEHIDVVYATTEAEIFAICRDLRNNPGRYRTVILDSLTEGAQQIMREIMEKVVADKSNNMKDKEVPSQREFGILYKRMCDVVREFRSIPETHVFFTAGAQFNTNQEEKTKRKMIMPDLWGKSATGIPGKMDEVYYLYVKDIKGENVRVLWTAHSEDILAGSRFGELPNPIQNPTMPLLYSLLVEKAKLEKENT